MDRGRGAPRPEKCFHVSPMQQTGCPGNRGGIVPVIAAHPCRFDARLQRADRAWRFGLVGARPEWQDGNSVGGRTCGNRRGTSESQHLLWMPSNVGNLRHSYCETDANARCTPPGVLLPSSCRASQGLQRTRRGGALFCGPRRFSFGTGPGEGHEPIKIRVLV